MKADNRLITITDKMRATEESIRTDALMNELTGLGMKGRDSRKGVRLDWNGRMPEDVAERIYASSGLAKRIVDKLPGDALRNWIEFKDFDKDGDVHKANKRLAVQSAFRKACSWGRMYGGAHLFMNTGESSKDALAKPLDLKNVADLKSLVLFSRFEMQLDGSDIEDDSNDPRFGMPRCYRLTPHRVVSPKGDRTLARIHHSRLISFDGSPLGLRLWIQNGFYHDSVFNTVIDSLTDYMQSNSGVAYSLNRFREVVHGIKGLAENAGAGQMKQITKRINEVIAVISLLGERIIDMENEKVDFNTANYSGVSDILEAMKEALAVCTEYPKIVLFQESPEGSMGGNGSSELEGYYNTVQDFQNDYVKPRLERYFEVLFAAKKGPTNGTTPPDWDFEFPPLWQMSRTEEAAAEYQEAQADDLRLQQGVLDEIDIMELRFPKKADKMTDQDKDAMREAMDQEKAARQAQMQAALEQGGAVVQAKDPKAEAKPEPKPAAKPEKK